MKNHFSHPLSFFLCPALLLAGAMSLHGADTVITSNTTWNGGTHDPDQDAVLLISHGSNDPTLMLLNSASASWEGATVIGNRDGESGNLVIQSGSTVSNTGAWAELGLYDDINVERGTGYIGLNIGSTGAVSVEGTGSMWTNSGDLILGGSSLTNETTGEGELAIEDGGIVSVAGTTRIHGGGTINLEGGGMLQTHDFNPTNGTFNWTGGTLELTGTYTGNLGVAQGATLTGGSTVSGNLSNAGVLSPGNSPGITVVLGDYSHESTATLNIEIGGLMVGDERIIFQGASGAYVMVWPWNLPLLSWKDGKIVATKP